MEMEFYTSIVPIALPFMVIPMGARAVSGSEERKTLDHAAQQPAPPLARDRLRPWRPWRRALACVLGHHLGPDLIAVPAAGVCLGPGRLAAALFVLWVFCLLFGALALLVSTWVQAVVPRHRHPHRRCWWRCTSSATSPRSRRSAEPIRVFSLFYHLGHPLKGDFPWTAVLLMLAAICVIGGRGGGDVRPAGHLHLTRPLADGRERNRREPLEGTLAGRREDYVRPQAFSRRAPRGLGGSRCCSGRGRLLSGACGRRRYPRR